MRDKWLREQSGSYTDILAFNVNGFPSAKANRRKLFELNRLMLDNDIMICIETGINSLNKPKRISDAHTLSRINFQEEKGNQ